MDNTALLIFGLLAAIAVLVLYIWHVHSSGITSAVQKVQQTATSVEAKVDAIAIAATTAPPVPPAA